MKWYSVKNYKLPASSIDNILVRHLSSSTGTYRLEVANYYGNIWVDNVNLEPLEDDNYTVTHFCVPDPIEIEE